MFEIFCSYAHADNDDQWVERFVSTLTSTYSKLTGRPPAIFLDRESLLTADVWERKIRSSLDASRIMIAAISPSYIRSEWCRREWKLFLRRETELRKQKLLGEEQGLIFPLLLFPLDRGYFNDEEVAFSVGVRERQWLDVSSQLQGNPIRPDQVRHLAERLIDTIAELEQRIRREDTSPSASLTTIRDPLSGLEWCGSLSSTDMSFEKALAYVAELDIGGRDWRLPTMQELESLLDSTALVDDPKASPFPLKEPFNAQRSGYLHSGTLVKEGGKENYVMNVRNGHIFNGAGYECYVRAVRTRSA